MGIPADTTLILNNSHSSVDKSPLFKFQNAVNIW